MAADLNSILKLEVPLVVVLGERPLKINEIRNWVPGSIIELAKGAEADLEVRVNNKFIGTGTAVKIGENFGIQVNYIGDSAERISAMGPADPMDTDGEDMDAESLAAALLDV